jgi:alkanesulfonate monooxygenase SsuD/methylene tetrahydromethanopterin reductase-like flavin-dependent oxidoreductase (luciferase family)
MAFEFGVFQEFPRYPARSDAEAFAQFFAQADAAERFGIDAIWLAELHFAPERSLASAPLVLASAIAARTRRLKIGIGVQVLPLCHPLRLAEEVATLDHVSEGRLILGVGRSGFPRSYEAYGVPYSESRERFAEVLEVLQRSWRQERFSFTGNFYNFRDIGVVPRPSPSLRSRLRVAATSDDTYTAIGAMGLPIFVAVRLGTFEDLLPQIEAYRAAYRAAGHDGQAEVYLRVPIYVGETEAGARADPEDSIIQFYRMLGLQYERSAALAGARANERRAEGGQVLQTISYPDVLRDKVIVGTPDAVAKRLAEVTRTLGLSGVLAELNCGGRVSADKVMHSVKLMGEQVAPHFR